ncbi:MAG: NTP transferase domain-containing protein [Proteobacteria bacterium]|nr:NTP transferase domain-containing protein [Pseudomonadota bacterium]
MEKTATDLNKNLLQDCDVFILAAGLGKRLKEITEKTPKPLVKVCDRELLDWNLSILKKNGFTNAIINLFYLPQQIKEFIGDGRRWGIDMQFSEEKILLDTGGGIKNIENRISKKYLITLNCDVLLDPNFSFVDLYSSHINSPNEPYATLVLREDTNVREYGEILINRQNQIIKLLESRVSNFATLDKNELKSMMYTGIQLISLKTFSVMPPKGEVFSITQNTYTSLVNKDCFLNACIYKGFWSDVGTPERLAQASKEFGELLKKRLTKN